MPPNSPLAIRLGLAALVLLGLGVLGFYIERADGSAVDFIHGCIILSVPLTALAAVVVQSRWKVSYREETHTWTHKEFTARVSSLRRDGDAAGLIEMFRSATSTGRRNLVLAALGGITDESVADSVCALGIGVVRSDEKETTRAAACDLLARHPAGGAVDALIGALDDSDSRVRLAAARSLGHLQARDAAPRLRVELGDTDAGVQAGFALAEMRDSHSLSAIEIAAAASRSRWHAKQLRQAAGILRENFGG